MDIFNLITWIYRCLFTLTAVLLLCNILRSQGWSKKLLGVFVVLPFLLRLFNIK